MASIEKKSHEKNGKKMKKKGKGLSVLIALGSPMKKKATRKKAKPKKRRLTAYDKKLMKTGRKEDKVADVLEEYKMGKLRSGSKRGPKVKSRKQALAIALREAGIKKKRARKRK